MEKFYCIAEDGQIYSLGEFDCWEDADLHAMKTYGHSFYTLGEDTFNDWRDTLNSMAGV